VDRRTSGRVSADTAIWLVSIHAAIVGDFTGAVCGVQQLIVVAVSLSLKA